MNLIKSLMLRAAFATTLTLAPQAMASPPELFPIQGLLTDAAGTPLDGAVGVRFALYANVNDTTPVWTEDRVGADALAVDSGYFSIYLGEKEPFDLSTLGAASELWLGLKIGDDVEMERVQLVSVPYALFSENAVGDITPRSIRVGGVEVIDDQGRWVGDGSGLVGPAGPQGLAGESVTMMSLEVGDEVCAYGGTMFTSGLDEGYACNGAPGEIAGQGPAGPQGPQGAIGPAGSSVVAMSIGSGAA